MENENKKAFFKTLPGILTGIAALITAITGLYLAFQSSRQPKDLAQPISEQRQIQEPRQPEPPMKEELPRQMRPARRLAEDFFVAYENGNISRIIDISATPFYFSHEVLVRPEDIHSKFEEVFSQKGEKFNLDAIETKTIGELRKAGVSQEINRIIEILNLNDEAIVIEATWTVQTHHEKLFLFTRWIESDLRLIGWYTYEN